MRLIKEKLYRGRKKSDVQYKRGKSYTEHELKMIMDELLMERATVYLGQTKIGLSIEVPKLDEEITNEFVSRAGVDKEKAKEIYEERVNDYKINFDPNSTSIYYMDIDKFEDYPGLKEKIIDYITKNSKDGKIDGGAIITIEFLDR